MKPKTWAALKPALQAGFGAFFAVGLVSAPFSFQAGPRAKDCTYYQAQLDKTVSAVESVDDRLSVKLRVEQQFPVKAAASDIEFNKRIKETIPQLRQISGQLDQLKDEQESKVMICEDAAGQGFSDGMFTASIVAGVLFGLRLFIAANYGDGVGTTFDRQKDIGQRPWGDEAE